MPIEEEPRDIHVVWEQLLPRESAPLVTVVEDEDDDVETDEEDPVEMPQEDEDDDVETDEEDPIELPQEDEDDEDEEEMIPLNSVSERVYNEVHDHIVELRDTVEELREIVAEQQTALTQKDGVIQDREERLTQTEGEKEQLIEMVAELESKLREEAAKRARAEDAYEEAFQRTGRAVRSSQAKRMKMEEMDKVFDTAINRAQDRVMGYPIQFETLPSFVLDRRTMFRVIEEERDRAKKYLNRSW